MLLTPGVVLRLGENSEMRMVSPRVFDQDMMTTPAKKDSTISTRLSGAG